ncbi:predicted protein [Naegleria gruberi]|uniref:Predicted protein n=1 Tax=Naegleria gruberi TaxID=5762 RepID=D2UX16_NAEGR|nr:uncharacterized protein NAEGRDRAFT_61602 [Naegleria gruberi]EFC50544.1 predicted protein [Naegleria gruberi]|eukprot:XP_002683288.1 predicted protein [Naegleria gruberi strain NEG-M]
MLNDSVSVVLDETIESKLLQGKSIHKFIPFKSFEKIKSYSLAEMNTPETIVIYNGKIIIGDTYNNNLVTIDMIEGEKKVIEFNDSPFHPFQIYIENGYKKDGKQSYGSALIFYCFTQGVQKHDMRDVLNEWNSSKAIWKLNVSFGCMIIDKTRGAIHVFPKYEFLSAYVPVVFPENTSFDLETGVKLSDNFKINRETFTFPVFGPDNSVLIHDGNTIEKLILKDGEYSDKDIGFRSLKKEGVYRLYYDNELTGLLFVIGKDYISVLDTNLIEKYSYPIDFVCTQIAVNKETSELFVLSANNKILHVYKIHTD